MKELETERLILRKFKSVDSQAIFRNWTSDEKVTEFLRWPAHKDIKETEAILKMWEDFYSEGGFYHWAIALKENDEPIGSISVETAEDNGQTIGIGFCIGRNYWNKGYAAESLERVISYFIEELGVNKVEARHDTKNPAAGKVMEKAGMKYEKTLKNDDINNQGTCDCHYYSITKKDLSQNENR